MRHCATMNISVKEEDPKRQLADNPELARGLPPAARSAQPVSLSVTATVGGRPPLELFSPEMFVPDPGPPGTASALLHDRHLRQVRRAIPFVDAPPEIRPRIRPSRTSEFLTDEAFSGLPDQPFSLSTDP